MEPIATASHRPSRRNAAVPAPPSSSSLFSPRRPNTAAQPHTAFAPRTQRLRRRLSPLSPDAAVAASQAPPSSTSLLGCLDYFREIQNDVVTPSILFDESPNYAVRLPGLGLDSVLIGIRTRDPTFCLYITLGTYLQRKLSSKGISRQL